MKRTGTGTAAIFIFSLCLVSGCGGKWGGNSLNDEKLVAVYAELAVNGNGDSLSAQRILDSLRVTREDFIAAVTEKAENLKEWQEFHEAAIKKMEVASLRGERRRTDLPTPLIR